MPAAADKFPTQILSAGSRYQYLNQTVHGCPPSKYCPRLRWRPRPAPLPFGSGLKWESDEWWNSQVNHPISDNCEGGASSFLLGLNEVFSKVLLQSGISFCSFVSPSLLSRELNEYLLQLNNALHPNNQINPAYIAPLYGPWRMNSALERILSQTVSEARVWAAWSWGRKSDAFSNFCILKLNFSTYR